MITVGVGDCRVSNDRNAALVTHALGSCIAVAVFDAHACVAGLLHLLLPESGLNPELARQQPHMFADTGIPDLLREVYAHGAGRNHLAVWLVGGAQVLDPNGVFQIGRKNYEASRRILQAAGIGVQAEAVGGSISRTLRLEIGSGISWNSCGGEHHTLASWTTAPGDFGPRAAWKGGSS